MADGVKITVSADASKVDSGLATANKSVDNFSKRVGGIQNSLANASAGFTKMGAVASGTFAKIQNSWMGLLAAFAAFAGIKGLFDEVGRVSDLANRFGTTAESIQKLGQAAEIGGSDLESLTKALFKSQMAATAAAEGNKGMQEAFAALGLDAESFIGLPIEEKLQAIAEGYVNNENKAQANAAAMDILGKAAMDIIPTLAMGKDGIAEAMEMTAQFSTSTAEKMGEVEDRFKAAFTNIKVWAIEGIGFVLEMVDFMSVGIAAAIQGINKLFDGIGFGQGPMEVIKKLQENAGKAKETYDETINIGLDQMEEKKAEQTTKTNAVKSSNLAAIKAEVESEKSGKGEESLAEKNAATKNIARLGFAERIRQAREAAKIEAEAKAKESAKLATSKKLEGAESTLSASQDVLGALQARQGGSTLDSLQRIGGSYANSSNANGASKQESLLQKQIDLQKAIVDEQKKTVTAIKDSTKSSSSFDGISS